MYHLFFIGFAIYFFLCNLIPFMSALQFRIIPFGLWSRETSSSIVAAKVNLLMRWMIYPVSQGVARMLDVAMRIIIGVGEWYIFENIWLRVLVTANLLDSLLPVRSQIEVLTHPYIIHIFEESILSLYSIKSIKENVPSQKIGYSTDNSFPW